MISTEEFIKNIDSGNIVPVVTKFFDEIMVLYNLIGYKHNIDICSDSESSIARFTLVTETEKEAEDIYQNFDNRYFSVYNSIFQINTEKRDNSVIMTIYK